MLRKILKMFKESDMLKIHLGIVLLGVLTCIFLKTDVMLTVVTPIILLCCTVGACLWLEKLRDEQNMDWAEGAVDEGERYARLEEGCIKGNPEYAYLHQMMKDKMAEMGVDYKKHLHPTWIDTFKIWMDLMVDQYEKFEMTDIQVAAAIMNTLVSCADSAEHIKIIFDSIKDLIKAPKKYECKFDEQENLILVETGAYMATSDPDEYVALMGEDKFIASIKEAAHSYEAASAEKTICGVFYDMYYTTKNM